MKISEVTLDTVKQYLRIDYDDDDTMIKNLMPAALAYISEHTALTIEQIDKYEDITIAYLILIEDMIDNRSMYVNKSNINRTVTTILDMHSLNNLG